jgi:AcrB/AcrD/AcrF family
MVPLSALTRFEFRSGPEFTMRFNEYRSAQLNGGAAPGYSAGQATKALEEVFAQTMPPEIGFDYSGMSFQEKRAAEGVSPSVIFGFSVLFVFLILGRTLRKLDVAIQRTAQYAGRGLRRLRGVVVAPDGCWARFFPLTWSRLRTTSIRRLDW